MFEQLGVKHYVGGSVASSVHGVARTTLDADLVAAMREEHVDALMAGLADTFYASEPAIRAAVKKQSSFNVIHLPTMFKVDVFIAKNRPFDESALQRTRLDTLGEDEQLRAYVASPEDVILSKLEWYRLGGSTGVRS